MPIPPRARRFAVHGRVVAWALAAATSLALAGTASADEPAGATCAPANPQPVVVHNDALPTRIAMVCSDPQGRRLSGFAQALSPAHGSVTTTGDGQVDYHAVAGYSGPDSFVLTPRLHDGGQTAGAPVTITVNVTTDPRPGPNCSLSPEEHARASGPHTIDLNCLGADHYEIVRSPQHGTIDAGTPIGGPLRLTYVGDAAFAGADAIVYRGITAGGQASDPVAIPIAVAPASEFRPPDCIFGLFHVVVHGSTSLWSGCYATDAPLTFTLADAPAHGSVVWQDDTPGGEWLYTPTPGYAGPDRWTATIDDHHGFQGLGVYEVTDVVDAPLPPPAIPKKPGVTSVTDRAARLLGAPGKRLRLSLGADVQAFAARGAVGSHKPLFAIVCRRACTITGDAALRAPGRHHRGHAAAVTALRTQRLRLKAGGAGTIRLSLTAAQRRAAAGAARPTVAATLRATVGHRAARARLGFAVKH
jgi:Bacterial Ig domain